MRDLHQCQGHNANVAVRSSCGVPSVLRQNHTKCGGAAFAAAALRYLSGENHETDVQFGHVASAGVGQQLLDGNDQVLDGESYLVIIQKRNL